MKKNKWLVFSLGINVICVALIWMFVKTGAHYELSAKIKNWPFAPKVAFLGDSITLQCELPRKFHTYAYKSFAYSGATTDQIYEKLKTVSLRGIKKIFLMAGINDLNFGKTQASILKNYQILLEDIKERAHQNATIYLQSILPIDENKFHAEFRNNHVRMINTQIKQLADNYQNVEYLDLGPLFTSRNNQLKAKHHNDGIHLNKSGCNQWSNILSEII